MERFIGRRPRQHPAMIGDLPTQQPAKQTAATTKPPSRDGMITVHVQLPHGSYSYSFRVRSIMGNMTTDARSEAGMEALISRALQSQFGTMVEKL